MDIFLLLYIGMALLSGYKWAEGMLRFIHGLITDR